MSFSVICDYYWVFVSQAFVSSHFNFQSVFGGLTSSCLLIRQYSLSSGFNKIEAQFAIPGITADSTKYDYVAALNQDTVSCLIKLLRVPSAENKYESIKTYLWKTFGLTLTRKVRANKLLHMDDLDNRIQDAFSPLGQNAIPAR